MDFWKKRPANFDFIWLEWNSYNSSIQIHIVWSRSSIFNLKSISREGWSNWAILTHEKDWVITHYRQVILNVNLGEVEQSLFKIHLQYGFVYVQSYIFYFYTVLKESIFKSVSCHLINFDQKLTFETVETWDRRAKVLLWWLESFCIYRLSWIFVKRLTVVIFSSFKVWCNIFMGP